MTFKLEGIAQCICDTKCCIDRYQGAHQVWERMCIGCKTKSSFKSVLSLSAVQYQRQEKVRKYNYPWKSQGKVGEIR